MYRTSYSSHFFLLFFNIFYNIINCFIFSFAFIKNKIDIISKTAEKDKAKLKIKTVREKKEEEEDKKKFENLVNIIKEDENISKALKIENEDILYIPPHKSLCDSITKSFDINNNIKLNLNKKDIEAITKLGILTHSFDANWIPQINYQVNENINNNMNYMEHKKSSKIGFKKNTSLGSIGTTIAGTQKLFYNDNYE